MRKVSSIVGRNVTVDLGDRTVLDSVDFSIEGGSFATVIGPNGAGKSTLMRCLDALQPGMEGQVEIGGVDIASIPRRQLARLVSYVPQSDDLNIDYSVQTYVEMGRYPYMRAWGSLSRDDSEAVTTALELTETVELRSRVMSTLSGGERQRVHIAAALAQGGSVLLLDEPTSFLDYRHQVQLMELLRRLIAMEELTIVAVTHDLNSIVPVSDLVLALKDGDLVFRGPPRELLSEQRLFEIFGTGFRFAESDSRAHPLVFPVGERL